MGGGALACDYDDVQINTACRPAGGLLWVLPAFHSLPQVISAIIGCKRHELLRAEG